MCSEQQTERHRLYRGVLGIRHHTAVTPATEYSGLVQQTPSMRPYLFPKSATGRNTKPPVNQADCYPGYFGWQTKRGN